MKFRIVAWLIVGVALCGPAPAAAAAPIVECIEAALPASTKGTIADNYRALGLSGLDNLPLKEFVPPVVGKCASLISGSGRHKAEIIGGLLTAFMLKHGSETVIVERHGVSKEALDAAWVSLTPEQRGLISMRNNSKYPPADAMTAFVTAARPDFAKSTVEQVMKANDPDPTDPEAASIMRVASELMAYGISRQWMEANSSATLE